MANKYDAIVIGSGLGGLTAGALYATEGKRVLVLEQHAKFGGVATTFMRKNLRVEVALHQQDGFEPDDPKIWVFKKLGILEALKIVPVDNLFTVRHPSLLGKDFLMPVGINEALQATIERFPQHKRALKKFFRIVYKIRRTGCLYEKCKHNTLMKILNWPIFPIRFWPMIRYERTTLGKLLHRLFKDDEAVKFALCANLPYFSDDPDRFSLLFYGMSQGSLFKCGGYYLKGGSQTLSNHLVKIIKEAGGKALSSRCVEQIIIKKGRTAGVIHSRTGTSNEKYEDYAPIIFGNAAPQQLGKMLPPEFRDQFLAKFEEIPLSTSLWSIYLGFNRKPVEFGVTDYTTFIFPDWMKTLAAYNQNSYVLNGKPGEKLPVYVFVDYSQIDSGLGSENQYLGVMCGLDRLENWKDLDKDNYKSRKAAWLECLVSSLDREFPGIKSSITFQEMATASTLNRYLKTPGGAVYGFAQEPKHAVRFRPGSRTVIDGLWLASSFVWPGGSFTGTMLAGAKAFNTVMKEH